MKIYSPMVSGSGALVVHKQLASRLEHYEVKTFDPKLALCPSILRIYKENAEIIHTAPDFGISLIPKESKSVFTFHNFYLDNDILKNATLFQRLFYSNVLRTNILAALKRADVITAVSDFTANIAKNYLKISKPLYVIKNGVDEHLFQPASKQRDSKDKVLVLFAGNPTKRKGADRLNEIASCLPENTQVICTSGLRGKAPINNKFDKLTLIPKCTHNEMPSLYNQSDIFLFPSKREGLSLVVLEAMACGLPIVSTNLSSMPELVDHGKGGYLCAPDNIKEMVFYVKKLANDKVLRSSMGAYNRERVLQHFSEAKMIKNYKELFATL